MAVSRPSPAASKPGARRVEANARLTATTSVVLLVLLAAEGVTLINVRGLLTAHVVIGMILVPPVLVKMATTGWRFARYYAGDPDYRAKGPPVPALRVLGPFVVALTVVLFASGIALVLAPTSWHGRLLTLHQASFFVWFAVMVIHVLGHVLDTARLAPLDWLRRTRRRAGSPGARQATLLASLGVGVVLAVILAGRASTYLHHVPSHHGHH